MIIETKCTWNPRVKRMIVACVNTTHIYFFLFNRTKSAIVFHSFSLANTHIHTYTIIVTSAEKENDEGTCYGN